MEDKNYGIESLQEAVKRDCEKSGDGCFSETGCPKERYQYVPAEGAMRKHTETVCRRVSKCTHSYCDKYKWVIERAEYYASLAGTTKERVLEAWERNRTYWYMNYYQDCNFPKADEKTKILKVDDWRRILTEKFGDARNWRFVCPICGHTQSVQDFIDAGADANSVYFNCIGRYKSGVGCNYTLGGLIKSSNTAIIADDYNIVSVFEMADNENKNAL